MKNGKFANFVVKGRYWFLGIFFVLLVASAVMFNFVNVNYDLTNYLPENSTTRESIELMKDEFGATGTASIMITKTTKEDAEVLAQKIENTETVATAVLSRYKFAPASTTKGCALISIFLENGDYTTEAQKAIEDIESLMKAELQNGQEYYLTGSAVVAGASRNSILGQIPTIMLVAIAIVLLVLAFTTRSWIEPIILLIVIGTAIIINMGTNLLLGEISFISNSVASVLLIALAMDYSIVLVNRFREEREKDPDVVQAMKNTIKGSLTTIISSGLTVMAGLISLVFMDYKIGLDLGLVLTKGVFISLLAVIFLMPSILILFSKIIKKTEHKNFLRGLRHIGTFTKATRFVMPVLFLGIVVAAFCVQHTSLEFNYVAQFNTAGDKVSIAEEETARCFGEQNELVLMFAKENLDTDKQIELFDNVRTLALDNGSKPANNESASSFATSGKDGIKLGDKISAQQLSVMFEIEESKATLVINIAGNQYGYADEEHTTVYAYNLIKCLQTNPLIQSQLSAEQKAQVQAIYNQEQKAESVFFSQNYVRMIFNIDGQVDSKESIEYITKLDSYLKTQTLSDQYYIVNNTQNVVETNNVFKTDRLKVELISALAILLIVMFAFKSISLPVLLVAVIEGAIWINLAGNAILGNSIFFICYLLGTAIQMGATIDYGILLSDRYMEARKTQNKFEAIKTAIDKSFATILSSGTILTLAALSIGIFSTVPLISSIGYLVGFGALCASICILFVLPQVLVLLDKLVAKTTLHSNFRFGKAIKIVAEGNIVETTATEIKQNKKEKIKFKKAQTKKHGKKIRILPNK